MEYPKKERFESLREKSKRHRVLSKRKENVRKKSVRILIVCEGTKTEPHYFEALVKTNASTVCEVSIEGTGRSTVSLVDEASKIKEKLEQKNAMHFDRVWVVFDKDDFDDFNKAIAKAKQLGFQSAWTNEAFELWYYLHFEYLDTAIDRSKYIEKLETVLRKKMRDNGFKYHKGNPDMYRLLQQYGSEDLAKRHAQKLRTLYTGTDYATHKPCTMVDKLVEELQNPDLLRELHSA